MDGYVRFPYRWRPTASSLVVPPATCVISNAATMRGRKGRGHKLTAKELAWIKANNTAQAVRNIIGKSRGWVNGINDAGEPIAEAVALAGNIAAVEIRQPDGWLKLKALHPNTTPGDFHDRTVVHLLTAVTPTNQPRLFGAAVVCWYPFIIEGEAWVYIDDVEYFSEKPQPRFPEAVGEYVPPDLAGYAAVVLKGSIIRQKANGSKVAGPLAADLVVRVISEINGWAKIGDRRWVELSRVRPAGSD